MSSRFVCWISGLGTCTTSLRWPVDSDRMFTARVVPQSCIPDHDLAMSGIAAACGEPPAVGAECQALHETGRATQCDWVRRLGRCQVPNLYGRVPTSGCQVATV